MGFTFQNSNLILVIIVSTDLLLLTDDPGPIRRTCRQKKIGNKGHHFGNRRHDQ